MTSGYIKVWRKLTESSIYRKSEAVHLFVHLLLTASRLERRVMSGNQLIAIKPGQLITGRKKLSAETGINESKVYRILELLKSEQVIEQQTNSKYSIITVLNWSSYQDGEQQIEQQMNSKRTADEQQVNTKQECKNGKKENINQYRDAAEVIDYLNQKTGKNFSSKTKPTIEAIKARLSEGWTVEDFKKAIDNQVAEWTGTEYAKYLTPDTLFRPSKFEKYVNNTSSQKTASYFS